MTLQMGYTPDLPYIRRLGIRAALFWVAARAALLAFGMSEAGAAHTLSVPALAVLAMVVGALCMLDARFMRESVFHANLGTPVWAPAAAGAAVTVLGEGAVAVVAGITMTVLS
jgi:hypothetical protein